VKKWAPFKASQPKGDVGVKPKGACLNCKEVGHYSKDCPKSKAWNGGSKVIALNANLAQGEYNRLIFLKGKIVKQDVLYLLDIGASHNFITRESAKRMELHLEKFKAPIEVHFVSSERNTFSTRKLERKGGFANLHLGWNGLNFGNGVHQPKQCVHRRVYGKEGHFPPP
jgi:hypothetical protein